METFKEIISFFHSPAFILWLAAWFHFDSAIRAAEKDRVFSTIVPGIMGIILMAWSVYYGYNWWYDFWWAE